MQDIIVKLKAFIAKIKKTEVPKHDCREDLILESEKYFLFDKVDGIYRL